ncbi:hypothetical protein B0T20DRAFT_450074 [Sordaria brevicollis]|uniref:Uncharacterized protein n=1 Tax=Sordaria brevicollis TaxID=83679 RepID=A0AAE0PNB9_SORBR|nr:hypothetical protein B0T20DRAFT_450074 [Sordaria brevicollis]
MADSTTSWLRSKFQPSRAQAQAKQQPKPILTSASEDSFVTNVTTIDGINGSESLASPFFHPTAAIGGKSHHKNGGGIRVVSNSESGSGNGNGSGSGGTIFGGNATNSGPPPPPKTPTTGLFSSGATSSTASLRRPSLPHQKSPSDSNVNGTTGGKLRSRPSATFQRVSSLLNLGGGKDEKTNSLSVTAPSSPSFTSGRPREGSGGSIGATSRFNFFRPSTPSAAAAPAPASSLHALPLSNWNATHGDEEDDYWLGARGALRRRRNTAASGESGSPWHNPNLMQMVETLQSVMMTKGDSMAPLPIQYNSLVHSVLEGFAHLNRQLKALEQEMAELRNLREKELEQFRGISEEWIQREDRYKAEIRRLEILLAKESRNGLASVTLARQGSFIDRSGDKRFQAMLKRMSTTDERDRARESDYDSGIRVVEDNYGDADNGTRDGSRRHTPFDNDVYVSQLIRKRTAENRGRRRSQLQQSMVPSPSFKGTLVESSSPSPSPPSPTKPYSNAPRLSHAGQASMSSIKESQPYSPLSTSSSSTASTASPEASRSLSQRRNINNLVIETGDVSSTAMSPRRRVFSYIEGAAEVLTTASDDCQHPFQDYYEFANTFSPQDLRGLGSDTRQPVVDTKTNALADHNSTPRTVNTMAAEDGITGSHPSTTLRPVDEDDLTTASTIGTSSSRSSNLPGLTPSNSTGSVIWVGKRNSRAAAAAAAADAAVTATSSSSATEEVDQPTYYRRSVGGGGENYELADMASIAKTTTAEALAISVNTNLHYNPTTAATTTATSPRLAPVPIEVPSSPRAGPTGPTIPPRTTSHQQAQQPKVGSVSPIKDRFEQLYNEQKKQQQPQNFPGKPKEKSPVRKTAREKNGDNDKTAKNNISATVAMFNEGT